jgi:hypothetical protein
MGDNEKSIESLLESAYNYGKSGYELVKLKTVDKISDVVSSLIPHSVLFVVIILFMVFFNLGLAFWFGELLGNTFYGFFIIAVFYAITGLVLYFFMHKWFKRKIYTFLIKQLLK